MPKKGKRLRDAQEKVDRNTYYEPREALSLAKELSSANFDETLEIAVKLGVNPRHADQQVRSAVVLPHGTGKDVTVLVFAKGEKEEEAKNAGADYVGGEELVSKIHEGWLEFDIAIATPDLMSAVGKLGKILGPRGLMPNPKSGTVTFEIEKAVQDSKAGKVEFRTDRTGNVHVPIGKASFSLDQLEENFNAVMDALIKSKPSGAKGQYIRKVGVSSTMGPGIKISPQKLGAAVGKAV